MMPRVDPLTVFLSFIAFAVHSAESSCLKEQYSSTGSAPCTDCAPGFSTPSNGTVGTDLSVCTDCAPGYGGYTNSNTNVLSCSSCFTGMYKDSADTESCTSCPSGTYTDNVGQTACEDCGAGYHSGIGYTVCYNDQSLSTDVTQVLMGCTVDEYRATSDTRSTVEMSIRQAVAGVVNVPLDNVLSLSVVQFPAYAAATLNSNITVNYRLEVVADSDISYTKAYQELTEKTGNGAFDNLLHLFATANGAPTCLSSSTSYSLEMVSNVPSQAPTQQPTMAPTSLDWDHIDYLLTDNLTYTIIISSIVGFLCLYYGGHGIYHLCNMLSDYQQRIENEHEETVKYHDDRLFKKFVKTTNEESSPHTMQMRQNFTAIYGSEPMSHDEMNKLSAQHGQHHDEENGNTMLNMTANSGGAKLSGGMNQRLTAMKEKTSGFDQGIEFYSPSKGARDRPSKSRGGSPSKSRQRGDSEASFSSEL